jgi:hypothetical protein
MCGLGITSAFHFLHLQNSHSTYIVHRHNRCRMSCFLSTCDHTTAKPMCASTIGRRARWARRAEFSTAHLKVSLRWALHRPTPGAVRQTNNQSGVCVCIPYAHTGCSKLCCWNCDGAHNLSECKEKRDGRRISEARRRFDSDRVNNATPSRYANAGGAQRNSVMGRGGASSVKAIIEQEQMRVGEIRLVRSRTVELTCDIVIICVCRSACATINCPRTLSPCSVWA